MAWLGLIYIVIFFGTPVGIGAYVFHRRGGAAGAEYRKRSRLADRYVRDAYVNADIVEEAIQRAVIERRNYRPPRRP